MQLRASLLTASLVLLLLAAGCTTTAPPPPAEQPVATAADSSQWTTKSAYVFVDGRKVGVTPTTVRIRRSFGTLGLSLRVGPKFRIIRKYELETVATSNQRMLAYSFGGSQSSSGTRFDAVDLPTRKDGAIIIIPYFNSPIQIDDREYNLTILVED